MMLTKNNKAYHRAIILIANADPATADVLIGFVRHVFRKSRHEIENDVVAFQKTAELLINRFGENDE